jgi:single-strand DNA-binding protein
MASFNQVTLVGNLTRDVEVRFIPSGQAVADVALAVNEKWTNKDGSKGESVAFVDCTLWGKTAEVAGEYLSKGSPVLFSGKLVQDHWEDKESGQKRSKLKVKVETMQFLGSKPDGSGGSADQSRERQASNQRQQQRPSGKAPHATQYEEYDPTPDDNTPF